jgi:hypothetical protein
MAEDLDTLTIPTVPVGSDEKVISNPANAWPGAGDTIVKVIRSGPTAIVQIGYDKASGRTWVRELPAPEHRWGDWKLTGVEEPEPPEPEE